MPTKVDEKASVSVEALQAQARELSEALERARQTCDADQIIALRDRLAAVSSQYEKAKCRLLTAQQGLVKAHIDQLDKEIAAKNEELAKAEAAEREARLRVAESSPGLNLAFLAGAVSTSKAQGRQRSRSARSSVMSRPCRAR